MVLERDLELLDDYLRNQLSGEEKLAFEQKLNSDAALKREFTIQQQVIASLKKARVAELKASLNNIQIPPAAVGSSPALKAALWTVIAALTGTGIYLYFNKPEETQPKTTIVAPENEPTANADTNVSEAEPQPSTPPVETAETDAQPAEIKSEKAAVKAKANKDTAGSQAEVGKQPVLDVFNPEEEGAVEGSSTSSQEVSGGGAVNKPSMLVEVDKNNKKYNFHYQFKEGKLFLYGPFESNLYEIMEFFSDEKRTAFLYYSDNYYLLNENSDKVQSLTVIKDAALLKKLKEYRGN